MAKEEEQRIRRCEKHGEYLATTHSSAYLPASWETMCPECETEAMRRHDRQEAERKERERRYRIAENRKSSGIPSRFADCKFENYQAATEQQREALEKTRTFALRFDEVQRYGSSLVLCGSPGTGKTHLGCSIGAHLLNSLGTVRYVTVAELIRTLRDTWRRDSPRKEVEVVRIFCSVDLLILDEVGVSFGGDAERIQLFDVLDGRYREKRPSVLISNLNGKELLETLGSRLYDRFMETDTGLVIFEWESYRRGSHTRRQVPEGPTTDLQQSLAD